MEIQSILINFVKLVYNDNPKQALKILGKLTTKPYHDLLNNVITKINFTKEKVINLQRISQRYYDKQQQINRLNMKIADLKIKKAKQIQNNQQLLKKFSIVQYLDAGQYQQAINFSNKYKFIKLEKIGKQLLEYRWFKQQAQSWELSLQNKQKRIQWTQNGKKIKTMFMNNRFYHQQMNKYLSQALNNLLSKQKLTLKLPTDYFDQICRDYFMCVAVQLHTLRDFKMIDEEQNIKLVQKASEKLNINLKKEKDEKFEQFFERFVKNLELLILQPNSQQILTLTRARSQRNYHSENYEMIQLHGQIKKIVQMSKFIQEQSPLSASLAYKQSIIACFRNIIANYEDIFSSLKANKQIIECYMQQSSNTFKKLDRINQEIQTIIPFLQNLEINKRSLEKSLEIFNKNVAALLDQYRKKVAQINRFSTSPSNQQSSQRSRHSLSDRQIFDKIEETQLNNGPQIINTQFLSKSYEDNIQKLNKQIHQLRQENTLLLKKNKDLKDAFEQQYRVKDIQKNYNLSLVNKIKVLEGFRNSIINTSILNQDTTFLELQQKYGTLSMQYDQLKRTLDQKQKQIRHSQQNKLDFIKRKQQTHSEEIKKWKQRYNNARQQVEDVNHQLLKLNQILEEKLFQQTKEHSTRKYVTQIYKKQQKQIEAAKERQVNQSIERQICERQYQQNTQNLNKQRLLQESTFKQTIQELENTIVKLKQQAVQRQKQHIEAQSKSKKDFEEIYQQLNRQKNALQSKIKDLQIKSITHNDKNIQNLHLFALGSIFQQNDYQQRLFLIQNLVSCVGRIKKTRLLYRADHYNKVNFHKYIDKEKYIVVIFKTIYGKLIAGYSQQAFDISGTKKGYGLILSLWARKVFQIKEKKAISYDDYFVIFGNSELRIKSLEFKLFSNFGIANGYFDNRGEKVNSILGEDKEREVELSQYEFYALDLDI